MKFYMTSDTMVVVESESYIENIALKDIQNDLFPDNVDTGVRKYTYEFRQYTHTKRKYKHPESGMEFDKNVG